MHLAMLAISASGGDTMRTNCWRTGQERRYELMKIVCIVTIPLTVPSLTLRYSNRRSLIPRFGSSLTLVSTGSVLHFSQSCLYESVGNLMV